MNVYTYICSVAGFRQHVSHHRGVYSIVSSVHSYVTTACCEEENVDLDEAQKRVIGSQPCARELDLAKLQRLLNVRIAREL